MKKFGIKRVLIEDGAESDAITLKVIKKMQNVPINFVKADELAGRESKDMDKESLRLIHYDGEVLKQCPGTKGYICCGYQILNIGINCPMDCSYCFLQSYMNQSSLRIFSNLYDKLNIINDIIDGSPNRTFRIGTGEFTDSLSLDYIVNWTHVLLPFFSQKNNCILELKTKTSLIEGLVSSSTSHRDRIVVAWSLNTPRIIANEERRTASLKMRILSAKKCQEAGFVLAFHFDPLIYYPGWEEEYAETIDLLEKHIAPESIIWISLGSFRYMPDLKWIIKMRSPRTHIFDGEFIPGLDKKFRYFKPIRIKMYYKISERLNKWHDDLGIYLCMESDDVWEKSLGWSPKNSKNLSDYLDNRVKKLMGN
jgi:spore photoproduct lyase